MCSLFFYPPDTAYVRIFISDVNDNKPAFAQSSYEVDVDEDADVGFAIITVSANDGDEGRLLKLIEIHTCIYVLSKSELQQNVFQFFFTEAK